MSIQTSNKVPLTKVLIKKCHLCGELIESFTEIERCPSCRKAFLPLNYFKKIQGSTFAEYKELFAQCDELCEEDLIKGIYVLW